MMMTVCLNIFVTNLILMANFWIIGNILDKIEKNTRRKNESN